MLCTHLCREAASDPHVLHIPLGQLRCRRLASHLCIPACSRRPSARAPHATLCRSRGAASSSLPRVELIDVRSPQPRTDRVMDRSKPETFNASAAGVHAVSDSFDR